LSQLGIEGQWLLDGIVAAGYRMVTQTVPMVARLVLLYGFGRRYRRQARERWEPDPSKTVAGRR
jgi:hypothetical protein